ncbi:enoyl-CoA hydratase/isomerase family protein [Paracoccus sp. TOH]|uniref:enoyl-CoA hydratase/isomerase family protein n=1 Tax=Paracoccus sp. TOH TaxID=1263728 RepID=UPI0025B1DA76|nr:enoyl-CoA hydratase/isomerase family protein [Paracoccus sp. TOH]WJS84873.1 enoyl-CoA hydratase/isomerase family protein [Paracoccus sp. TOH]
MIARDFAGGIGRVTISRPDKANSLTGAMLAELTAAFEALAAEPGLRAVILTGEGTVFSAGADLDEARAGLALSPEWERLSSRVAAMPCLTIAALNGTAAGGAMGMVLACDLRLAVPGAKFFYPVMRLGFLPQPSDPPRMRALIGPSRAKMILMAGQKIPADEALAWGLVDRLVAPDALLDEAEALAADVRAAEAGQVAAIKRMLD